jgi:hypothetical protein
MDPWTVAEILELMANRVPSVRISMRSPADRDLARWVKLGRSPEEAARRMNHIMQQRIENRRTGRP